MRPYDFPRSLQPAPRRCESGRSAGTTLTAEGYREPQVRAREEVEGPSNRKKNSSRVTRVQESEILARESSKDLVYMFIHTYIHSSTYIHTYIHTLIPPREDQCEWHRMTRMTGPDCVVMCNLINTYIHRSTYIHTYIHT